MLILLEVSPKLIQKLVVPSCCPIFLVRSAGRMQCTLGHADKDIGIELHFSLTTLLGGAK